jgi:hypothetical protein
LGGAFSATKIGSFCNYKEKKKRNSVVGIMFVAEKAHFSCKKSFSQR